MIVAQQIMKKRWIASYFYFSTHGTFCSQTIDMLNCLTSREWVAYIDTTNLWPMFNICYYTHTLINIWLKLNTYKFLVVIFELFIMLVGLYTSITTYKRRFQCFHQHATSFCVGLSLRWKHPWLTKSVKALTRVM